MPGKKSGKIAAKKKSGNSSNKPKKPQNTPQNRNEEVQRQLAARGLLSTQDHIGFVRPFWESVSQEEHDKLLTIDISELKERAQLITEQNKLEFKMNNEKFQKRYDVAATLERGLERLKTREAWKVWKWSKDSKEFTDSDSFRKEVEETYIPEDLKKLLPKEEGKVFEKPAEAALRERMTKLVMSVHSQLQSNQEAWKSRQRSPNELNEANRELNIEFITHMLEVLQAEQKCLYHTILTPIIEFMCATIPYKERRTSQKELYLSDLDKLSQNDIGKIYEWLTEKVDSLSSKLKPDPKEEEIEEEEEVVGDIDLFSLTDSGNALTVNPKWLEHLLSRRLSEDGQPRRFRAGEECLNIGLVLEWVYGSIVSTAEKGRESSKRNLGPWEPTVKQAYGNLMTALKKQKVLYERRSQAIELLEGIAANRNAIADLADRTDCIIPGTVAFRKSGEQSGKLSDEVILAVLQREKVLADAKLHILQGEHAEITTSVKTVRTSFIHGDPELERLKRELSEVETFSDVDSAVIQKEKQRIYQPENVLDEQLEIQNVYREQGINLQGIYDKQQKAIKDFSKREQEIAQLKSWQFNVQQLILKFKKALLAEEIRSEMEATAKKTEFDEKTLENLRFNFHKDFKKQLYSDLDDQAFYSKIKIDLSRTQKKIEEVEVILQHLEMALINVACDDPGSTIGMNLMLPAIQERLDEKALDFSTEKASLAMEDLLRILEEEKAKQMEQVEKERQIKKSKLKSKASELEISKEHEVELTKEVNHEVNEENKIEDEDIEVPSPFVSSKSTIVQEVAHNKANDIEYQEDEGAFKCVTKTKYSKQSPRFNGNHQRMGSGGFQHSYSNSPSFGKGRSSNSHRRFMSVPDFNGYNNNSNSVNKKKGYYKNTDGSRNSNYVPKFKQTDGEQYQKQRYKNYSDMIAEKTETVSNVQDENISGEEWKRGFLRQNNKNTFYVRTDCQIHSNSYGDVENLDERKNSVNEEVKNEIKHCHSEPESLIKTNNLPPVSTEVASGIPKKNAWIKGAIPASVKGKTPSVSGDSCGEQPKTKTSVSSEKSLMLPTTPDASEAEMSVSRIAADSTSSGHKRENSSYVSSQQEESVGKAANVDVYFNEVAVGTEDMYANQIADSKSTNALDDVDAKEYVIETEEVSEKNNNEDAMSEVSVDAPALMHMMMGPPIMPPPFGMPPPPGYMPGFHNFNGRSPNHTGIRSVYPLPPMMLPHHMYHPHLAPHSPMQHAAGVPLSGPAIAPMSLSRPNVPPMCYLPHVMPHMAPPYHPAFPHHWYSYPDMVLSHLPPFRHAGDAEEMVEQIEEEMEDEEEEEEEGEMAGDVDEKQKKQIFNKFNLRANAPEFVPASTSRKLNNRGDDIESQEMPDHEKTEEVSASEVTNSIIPIIKLEA